MKQQTLKSPGRTSERRAKAALALLAAFSIALIVLGVMGIGELNRSGYDDASGFAHIRDAGRYADKATRENQALLSGLTPEQRGVFGALVDQALREAWQRVRYSGETLDDFRRAEPARQRAMMDSLLRETPDPALRAAAMDAVDAVYLAQAEITPEGLPANEALLRQVLGLLPPGLAQGFETRLAAIKAEEAGGVRLESGRDAQALFEEAVGERRMSRFVDAGAGLIPVARALFARLDALGVELDLTGALALLMQVPRNQETDAGLTGLAPGEAIPRMLGALDPQAISGAKLVAFNKELYAALKAAHPDIAAMDHQELLQLQAAALQPEFGQQLEQDALKLEAQAWNRRLKPLLTEALDSAGKQVLPGKELFLQALTSLMQGDNPETALQVLAGTLMDRRDQDTAQQMEAYLNSLPEQDALGMKIAMLRALMAFQPPETSQQTARELSDFNPEMRQEFRQGLLLAMTDGSRPLPLLAARETPGDNPSPQVLFYLLLSSQDASGSLLGGQTDVGLRLAIRQNAARVRAAASIAEGGGSAFSVLKNSQGKVLALVGALLLVDVLLLFFLMRSGRDWRFDVKWLMILLIVDFLLVFQILPLGFLLYRALTPGGTLSLVTFGRLFSYNMNRGALFNTITAGLAATGLGTLMAFPLAFLVGRTNLYGKLFFRRLFVLTYMVPPYVGAMAWLRLLNPNVGSINIFLRGLLGISASSGPVNVYSLGGLIWVLTTFYYPYAFITISRAMEKMDPSLEEASRISGASPFTTLMRVTLPIMTPSLIAGALLVFVSAASCYGIPSIIGAPGRVHTVTTRIIEYYGRGTQGLNDATGLAVFLMALAILILYLSDFVLAKKQYITVSGKSTRPNIVDLRAWRLPLTILVSLFAVLIVLIPFTTILTTSLKIDVGKSLLDAGNFTFSQWTTIFSRSETLSSLKNSLIYASVAASVGILVAITMSYLMQRTRIRGRKLPDFLITLGSGSPSVVIALGLIMSMQGRFGVNIYNTAYILIVAYLIKYMMMGMRTVSSAISQIHVSLEESSQVSGASWLMTMRRVTGPLIFPSIAAGWFLIFIPCFYELSMTTLLYSNTTKTIGFQLYEYWTYTSQPQASAMAFGILLIVILINQFFNRLTRGGFSI